MDTIERVAKEICRTIHGTHSSAWDETINPLTDEPVWKEFIPHASAAITTLTEAKPCKE